jgi:nitrate/TMAO reductase-like tetraheme cytochrome c subunit
MKRRKRAGGASVIPRVIVSLLLFVGLTAGVAWGDNTLCLGCHKDESLTREDARGRKVSLFVSEAGFASSVHGKLSCSNCHTHIKDDAHAEGGKKVADKSVNCGACHKEAEKEYQQGLHAKMIMKGTERAAYCNDCHGKHNILPSKNPKSMTNVANIAKTCERCHSDVEFVKHHALGTAIPKEEFKTSVHGKSGEVTCTSCHGSHNLRSLIDPKSTIFRSNIPQTCGSCHPDITKQFTESAHGLLAARGRSDSPTCTTCHGFHGIKTKIDPDSPVNERRIAMTTCPQCHAAERVSKEYALTTMQVKSYYDSFHGLSYRGGDTYSANCASCHGVHDIRPSSDPQSMIHRDNLQKTCGSCHPGASENFAKGKIHSVASIAGEDFGEKVVGWVRIIYIQLIVLVIGGLTFFNFMDWLRKTIDRVPK